MKKIKFILGAIVLAFVLVACNSRESLLSKYEKACQEGDGATAAEVLVKLDKYDLSHEDSVRMDNARKLLAEKIMKDIPEVEMSSNSPTDDGLESEEALAN